MWKCENKCCCWQPMIEKIYTNIFDSRFIKKEILWEGTYKANPDSKESSDLWKELRSATIEFLAEPDVNDPDKRSESNDGPIYFKIKSINS